MGGGTMGWEQVHYNRDLLKENHSTFKGGHVPLVLVPPPMLLSFIVYSLHTDVNECAENQADCINEAVCVNIIGNYSCNCPGGYTGDGRLNGSGCMGKKLN